MSKAAKDGLTNKYLDRLYKDIDYATKNNELFEFLISLAVVGSQLMHKYPEVSSRVRSAIGEATKILQSPVMH